MTNTDWFCSLVFAEKGAEKRYHTQIFLLFADWLG